MVKRLYLAFTIAAFLNLTLTADFEVETFKLSNGLSVILSPTDDVQSTCVLMYHKTGARDDPPKLKGAISLFHHLMLLGTRNLEPLERLMFVEKYGGTSNRRVWYDNAIFYHVVPDSELNNALWLESERINSLKLTDRDIDMVKNRIYRTIYNRRKANASYEANEWMKAQLFAGTVYQTPLYGSLEEIKGFDNQEIKRLYDRFRNPADIILVIAGKFAKEELIKHINRHFAGLLAQRRSNNVGKNSSTPNHFPAAGTKPINVTWSRKNTAQHFFMYGVGAPSKRNFDHLFFNFIRYYLVDERVSRLDKMMNRANDLGVTIHSEYTNHFEANALIIKVTTSSRADLYTAKYILNKELDALMSKPLSLAELKAIKTLMEIDFKKDMATLEKRSLILAENWHLSGGNLKIDNRSFEQSYIDRIRQIDSQDILDIAKKYLKTSGRVILNVYKQTD